MADFFTAHPGETAAPLPPGPILCTGSAGMRRVHRFFLWAYDEAPGLVRSTDAGDTARAAYVGEVLGNFDGVLQSTTRARTCSCIPSWLAGPQGAHCM